MLKFARRSLLAAAIGCTALVAVPQAGQAQRHARPETKWCLRGPTGGQACLFHTLEQCRKSASGTGGSCMRNPRYRR